MTSMNCEQENDAFIGLQSYPRSQSVKGLSLKTNAMPNTPMTKGFSAPLKTPIDKSVRKAFGNVKNVLNSTQTSSTSTKTRVKAEGKLKESKGLSDGSKMGSNDIKQLESKAVKAESVNIDPKFTDEIENMFPDEDMLDVVNESVSQDMFAIDVRDVKWDDDMSDDLIPNKQAIDLNDLF